MLKKTLGVALIAVAILVPIRFMHVFGYFQRSFKHHPGTCRKVQGLDFGSEDFEILTDGLTFITSGIFVSIFGSGYRSFMEENSIKGRIYVADLKKTQTEAKELKIKASNKFQPSTFRPHGISVLEDTTKGQHLLYVVNHPDGGEDRVEKFRYLPDTGELEHVKSIFSSHFHLTNDLALIGKDTFYITDYAYFNNSQFLFTIELFAGLKLGSILYFNGSEFTSVESGLMGPNGIALSKDKRYLYISVINNHQVNVYKVNPDTSIELLQEVSIDTAMDNIHLSQDGRRLYGGCHPIDTKLMAHLKDPKNQAPSQVLNLPLKDGLIDVNGISQVFYDHGDLISGSSVASIYDKKLLIGSVINKLAVCDLP